MPWFGGKRKQEIAELRDLREELRAVTGAPWVGSNPNVPFNLGGPAHPSQANIDSTLRLAPVYGAVRILADGVASLPIKVYRDVGSKKTRWNGPSLFDKPSAEPNTTIYDWLHMCMTSLALDGNAFGFVAARDKYGYPTVIEWMHPDDVFVQEPGGDLPNPMSAKYFYRQREIPKQDVLHVKAFTVPGKVRAVSPLRAFAGLVGQGLDMQQYGADWFKAGGFPTGVFQNTEQEVDEPQSDEIKSRLRKAIRARVPLVVGRDWNYTPIRVPPSEAQFVEATKMNATQIAAVYGVPPERIGGARGDSLTYATQEMDTISLATDTLRPWLVRLENAFFGVLPERRYVRFNVDAMIRTDLKTRHEVFEIDRRIGLKPNDDLRAIEDLEPLPDGAGKDNRPLEVLVAEARGTQVVPEGSKGQPTDKPAVQDQPGGKSAAVAVPAAKAGSPPTPNDATKPFVPKTAGNRALRASNQDRREARATLTRHLNDGRLPRLEWSARCRMADDASTLDDLDSLFTDLPHLPDWMPHRDLAAAEDGAVPPMTGNEARAIVMRKRPEIATVETPNRTPVPMSANGKSPAKAG